MKTLTAPDRFAMEAVCLLLWRDGARRLQLSSAHKLTNSC